MLFGRKTFFSAVTILSILGYGLLVFASPIIYSPGETLDPADPTCLPDGGCTVAFPGAAIGDEVSGGVANQVLYTDVDGNVFGDSLFTRDSTTGNTTIGVANGIVASTMSLLNTGNTLTWDADTTDDIQDLITQNQNIAGVGIIGNGITHVNTSTGEAVDLIIGDLTAVSGRPFSANMGYSNAAGNIRHGFLVDDTGAAMSHSDSVANTRGYMATFPGGNVITWDADTTDTITTNINQNQDLFGLGAFSGTGLGWEDSATNIKALVVVGDGTPGGGTPGETILTTVDTGTGDQAAVSTFNDPIDGMNVSASAQNGNIGTGLFLSSTDGIFNYRTNGGVGQEAMVSVTPTETFMSFVVDSLSSTYKTSLGDGTFKFSNASNGNNFLNLDAVSGLYEFGDLGASLNGTRLAINDVDQAITFDFNGDFYSFPTGDGVANYLLATDGLGQLFWQDPAMVPSDRSLKSNVNELSYGLDTLMQLNPVSYTMNSTGKDQIGFIAQEVESLVPELVGEVANGKKGLAYGQLTAVIVKSVQELDLKIDDIENFADSENKTFLDNMIEWLGDASNGITNIFADRVDTHELCIDGQCLDQEDVRQLLELKNSMSGSDAPSSDPQPDPTPSESSEDPAPEVVPESNSEPEPQIEPESESEPEPSTESSEPV